MKCIVTILSDDIIKEDFDFSILDSHPNGLDIFRKVKDFVSAKISLKDKIAKKPISNATIINRKHKVTRVTDAQEEVYFPKALALNKYYIDIMADGYKPLKNDNIFLDTTRQLQEITIELGREK